MFRSGSPYSGVGPSIDNPPLPALEPDLPVSPTAPHTLSSPLLRALHTTHRPRNEAHDLRSECIRDPNYMPLSSTEEASTLNTRRLNPRTSLSYMRASPRKKRRTRSTASSHGMHSATTASVEQLGGIYGVVQCAVSEGSASPTYHHPEHSRNSSHQCCYMA